MKISLITSKESNDITQLSGAPYYMAKALEKHYDQVIFVQPDPAANITETISRIINKSSKTLLGKKFATGHSLLSSYFAGRHFSTKIKKLNPDIILAATASTQITFLRKYVPLIYTTDATFKLMENYYDAWTDLNKLSSSEGNYIEQRAINNSDRICCPSSWAANSVIQDYKAPASKVSVIQWGANLDDSEIPLREEKMEERDFSHCNLLFVGVEWERKGGKIAIEALNHLLAANIPATLTIVGCDPPGQFLHERIQVISNLDKTIPEERKKLIALYKKSHFFLLPTRAEAFGLVFSEAAAFGLPVITTDTGGVSSVVRPGLNGFTLPLDAPASAYAKLITEIFEDRNRYTSLARTSRQVYHETLNWDTWGSKMHQLISDLLYTGGIEQARGIR